LEAIVRVLEAIVRVLEAIVRVLEAITHKHTDSFLLAKTLAICKVCDGLYLEDGYEPFSCFNYW
jgi:hypothetical protein